MNSVAVQAVVPGEAPSSQTTTGREGLVGQTLKDTYRIVRAIAAGGMGAVYEGEHTRLGRRVAVKVLLTGLESDPRAVARFQREAEIIASLGHPQIVQVFDVDETDDGAPYLVMEYLDGESLADRLDRDKRLPITTALGIVSKIASALASVHAHGIVHRDLKPANVFLLPIADGEFVKLLDFGISKIKHARRITLDDAPIGTPDYMAPEQITRASAVDAATDQFALAVMSYEMLTGKLPFARERVDDILRAILSSTPAPVSELAPWLGAGLDAVIARGLSKHPAQRFPSISQFAWALENAARASGVATRAEPPSAPGRYSVLPGADADLVDTNPPSSRPSKMPQALRAADRHVEHAERLLADVRVARDLGELDDAVFFGEKLLDVATHSPSDAMYSLLGTAIPLLDEVFSMRVGPVVRRLRLGPADPRRLHLTPRAAALRSLAEGGATVENVIAQSGLPRRDALRLLAGLLRRRALAV